MKKLLLALFALVLLFSATAALAADILVGVAMPTQSLQRWNEDGANMKKILEGKGYKVDLQYAENNVSVQISQLENMITKGVKVMIIASIDGSALSDVLAKAGATPAALVASFALAIHRLPAFMMENLPSAFSNENACAMPPT